MYQYTIAMCKTLLLGNFTPVIAPCWRHLPCASDTDCFRMNRSINKGGRRGSNGEPLRATLVPGRKLMFATETRGIQDLPPFSVLRTLLSAYCPMHINEARHSGWIQKETKRSRPTSLRSTGRKELSCGCVRLEGQKCGNPPPGGSRFYRVGSHPRSQVELGRTRSQC